jgi:hypothetical protein
MCAHHGILERLKNWCSLFCPLKALLCQQLCQRFGNYSIVSHKLSIVSCQPQNPLNLVVVKGTGHFYITFVLLGSVHTP